MGGVGLRRLTARPCALSLRRFRPRALPMGGVGLRPLTASPRALSLRPFRPRSLAAIRLTRRPRSRTPRLSLLSVRTASLARLAFRRLRLRGGPARLALRGRRIRPRRSNLRWWFRAPRRLRPLGRGCSLHWLRRLSRRLIRNLRAIIRRGWWRARGRRLIRVHRRGRRLSLFSRGWVGRRLRRREPCRSPKRGRDQKHPKELRSSHQNLSSCAGRAGVFSDTNRAAPSPFGDKVAHNGYKTRADCLSAPPGSCPKTMSDSLLHDLRRGCLCKQRRPRTPRAPASPQPRILTRGALGLIGDNPRRENATMLHSSHPTPN